MSKLWGVFGQPYLDLSPYFDTSCFPRLDREITRGLAELESEGTGGSLKWMGVVAPWQVDDGYEDLGFAIERMSEEDLLDLVALADDPTTFDRDKLRSYTFGDETDHPLNLRQQRLLAYRHGVYFPWKVCHHLLENDRWEDKHSGQGKRFTEDAERVFPETLAFLRALPFTEIGRCVIFGLQAHDHAPFHRDTEPGKDGVAHCLNFAPRPGKRLVLASPDGEERVPVEAPIYWFNDMDWHGVEAAPVFRYSIRVDGRYDPAFVRKLAADARRRR